MRNDLVDNLRLDINRSKVRSAIYVRLGDTRTRTIHFTLANNGVVYDLSELIFAEVLIKKPDGNENDQAMVQVGNELQYTLRTQDINVAGECVCQLMLTFKDGAVITSPDFLIVVFAKTVNQKTEKSMNEYTAITQQLVDARGYADIAKNAVEDSREYAARAMSASDTAEAAVEEVADYAEAVERDAESARESMADAFLARNSAEAAAVSASSSAESAANNAAEALVSQVESDLSAKDAQSYAEAADASIQRTATNAAAAEQSKENAFLAKTEAQTAAINAKSYTVGGTGTRLGEDTDNAAYYYQQIRNISGGVGGGIVPMGTCTFEELQYQTKDTGYMYNISNDFITDETFVEGTGTFHSAGTNVYWLAEGKWDCMAGSDVLGVKGSAEEAFKRGYVSISPEDIGLGNVENTADADKNVAFADAAGIANRTYYGTCSTASNAQDKIVQCPGFFLAAGSRVTVKFTSSGNAPGYKQITLDVNGTGAKPVVLATNNTAAYGSEVGGNFQGNAFGEFVYDGENYVWINGSGTTGAKNITGTKLFLLGTQAAGNIVGTRSNKYVYIGTDNCLYSNESKVITSSDLDVSSLLERISNLEALIGYPVSREE